MKLAGTWHITEMDEWDEDYCNMEVQAYLKLNRQGNGEFQFGLVHGYIVMVGWTMTARVMNSAGRATMRWMKRQAPVC